MLFDHALPEIQLHELVAHLNAKYSLHEVRHARKRIAGYSPNQVVAFVVVCTGARVCGTGAEWEVMCACLCVGVSEGGIMGLWDCGISLVLCCAVLCCAVLCCAVPCRAVLCCAALRCAVLCRAVLCCVVLCCANACSCMSVRVRACVYACMQMSRIVYQRQGEPHHHAWIAGDDALNPGPADAPRCRGFPPHAWTA